MKKLIAPAVTGVLFLSFIPSIAPAIDLSVILPHIYSLWQWLENAARCIVPDEIEELISTINAALS